MERIKLARDNLDLTQKELAKIMGVSQPTVSLWEKGEQDPTLQNVHELCKHLKTNPSYLMGYSSDSTMQVNLNPEAMNIALRWNSLGKRGRKIVDGKLAEQEQLIELEAKRGETSVS